MSNQLNLLVNGARGRMGQAVISSADSNDKVTVIAAIDQGDSLANAIQNADVVIDFSHHSVTAEAATLCGEHSLPLVIGTTGHSREELEVIKQAADSIPVVLAPNFSVGVNTLFWLANKAATSLGDNFDIEVIEMHHRHKVDAPSGTARRLAEILAAARSLSYEENTRHGRQGITGAREKNEIGVHALRGGDVVGDHTVVFAADGERLELTHKASSRETFANGSIRAAIWASSRPPGLYDMQDVLGLVP